MKASRQLTLLIYLIAMVFGSFASSYGADEPGAQAKAALRKKAYPWYDASKDSYKSLKPEKEIDPPNFNTPNIPIPFIQILLWIVLGLIVALIVFGIIHWIRNSISPPLHETAAAPTAEVTVEQLEALPESARGVRDLLGEALRLAALGAYGQAMTFYYSWQLTQLDRQSLIELQKGKTNRQYLGEVRRNCPDVMSLFGDSIRLFEDAFFGHLEIDRESFFKVWEQRAKIERARSAE